MIITLGGGGGMFARRVDGFLLINRPGVFEADLSGHRLPGCSQRSLAPRECVIVWDPFLRATGPPHPPVSTGHLRNHRASESRLVSPPQRAMNS